MRGSRYEHREHRHPDSDHGLAHLTLHTSDAHGLYGKFGLAKPDHTCLERPRRQALRQGLRRQPAGQQPAGQLYVRPSIRSLIRSACPQWPLYSRITCRYAQRRLMTPHRGLS